MRWSAFSAHAPPRHTVCFYMFVELTAAAPWAARALSCQHECQPTKTSLQADSGEIKHSVISPARSFPVPQIQSAEQHTRMREVPAFIWLNRPQWCVVCLLSLSVKIPAYQIKCSLDVNTEVIYLLLFISHVSSNTSDDMFFLQCSGLTRVLSCSDDLRTDAVNELNERKVWLFELYWCTSVWMDGAERRWVVFITSMTLDQVFHT